MVDYIALHCHAITCTDFIYRRRKPIIINSRLITYCFYYKKSNSQE